MTDYRELRGAALGAIIIACYMALVLASGRVDPRLFFNLITFYIGISFVLWVFLLGWVILFVLLRAGRQSGNEPFLKTYVPAALAARWKRDRFVSLVWPPILFATLLASFNSFKQQVLPAAGFGWDAGLAAADKALFFGVDPWRVTHAVFGSPEGIVFVDHAYHSWFVPMSLGVIICAFLPRTTYALRTQYLLSYIMVWIGIGSIGAYLMPSAGPVFYERFTAPHPSFHELVARLHNAHEVTGAAMTSLTNQAMLLKLYGEDTLAVGGGISAMPSVHNALAILFAFAGFRVHRALGVVLAVYALFIWIGSIHLGWHYALDGIVAFVMTGAIWAVCGRITAAFDRESPRQSAELTAPATA